MRNLPCFGVSFNRNLHRVGIGIDIRQPRPSKYPWNKKAMTHQELRHRLEQLAQPSYRDFVSILTPGAQNILGVRIPHLHNLAAEITSGDFREFLWLPGEGAYHEERMVCLLVIARAKIEEETRRKCISEAAPQLLNWAECDIFCSALKKIGKDAERTWRLIQPHLKSGNEFEIRFAVIMILLYFLGSDHIDRSLRALAEIKHEGYYVKMAVAWALCEAFIKQREKTISFFQTKKLDPFTSAKTASKICGSRRIPEGDKALARQLLG